METPIEKQKVLSKREKNVCLWIWGNVPTDIDWVRSSKLFQEKMQSFDTHVNRWTWPSVDIINKLLSGNEYEKILGSRLNEIYGNPTADVVNEQTVKEIFEPWK